MLTNRTSARVRSLPGIARSGVTCGAGRISGAVVRIAIVQAGSVFSVANRPTSPLPNRFHCNSCHAAPVDASENNSAHVEAANHLNRRIHHHVANPLAAANQHALKPIAFVPLDSPPKRSTAIPIDSANATATSG